MDLGDIGAGLEKYRAAAIIYEDLLLSDPADTITSRDLASLLHFQGDVLMKTGVKTSPAARAQTLREARSSYQRSLELWRDIQNRGVLHKADQNRVDELSRRISECDAAITKLGLKP